MRNNVTREDLDAVVAYLSQEEPRLTQSKQVAAFEEEWSKWLDTRYSVFVNSGSSANLLTMAVLREIAGTGEIIVPPVTWVSDIAAVLHCGFTPVFADISPASLSLNEQEVLKKITDRTKAVFLTHALGYNGLTEQLLSELKTRNIPLIEDACEAHGTVFQGRKAGTFGLMSNFSFYYGHHLSTIEGGMICTDEKDLYELARMFRGHGLVREADDSEVKESFHANHPDLMPDFIFAVPAYNVRSTEIQAVIGRSQLVRLNQNNEIRRRNLEVFLSKLDSSKYFTEFNVEGSCNYAFSLMIRKPDDVLRDRIIDTFRQNGIEFRRGTSGGGNQLRQPYLRKLFGDEYRNYPVADHVHFYGFYLGNYPDLEQERIEWLCETLNGL